MFELAGGLYWPIEQALHTDINYIFIAQAGRVAELNSIFGSGDKPKAGPPKGADGKPLTLTANVFDIQFDHPHNPRINKRHG